jgi:hypothetical protein
MKSQTHMHRRARDRSLSLSLSLSLSHTQTHTHNSHKHLHLGFDAGLLVVLLGDLDDTQGVDHDKLAHTVNLC